MSSEKFVVKVANKPSVKITEATTIVSKVVIGTPIRKVDAANFNATTLGGESAGYYLSWNNITNVPNTALLQNIEDRDSGVTIGGITVVKGSIVPDSDIRYNIGTPSKRFGSLYVKGDTIFVGNLALSDAGNGQIATANAQFETDSQGRVVADSATLSNARIVSFVDSASIIDTINRWVRNTDGDSNGPAGLDTYFDSAYVQARVDTTFLDDLIDSDFVTRNFDRTLVDSARITKKVSSLIKGVGDDLTTTTSDQVVDEFTATQYRTCKYIVQLEHDDDSKYQSTEILLTHNGTNAYITEYAIVQTDSSLGDFSADISNGVVRLLLTPTFTNTSFKAKRISIDA